MRRAGPHVLRRAGAVRATAAAPSSMRGHVLAVEAAEGIAALLAARRRAAPVGRRRWARRSAVARRIERPRRADARFGHVRRASAQLAGVAVVGGTADALAHGIELADDHGLFLLAALSGGAP